MSSSSVENRTNLAALMGPGIMLRNGNDASRNETRSIMQRVFTLLMAVILTVSVTPGSATSFEPKSFDQLVAEADEIFVGTAAIAAPRKRAEGGIVTDVTFTNLQILKGNAANTAITLMTMGGSVGGETFEIRGLPKFQIGITYLVFVQGNGTTIFPVVGGDQGMFQVKLDAVTGESLVFNSRGMPIVDQSVLQAVSLQSPSSVPLAVFLQAVRSRMP